LVEMMLASLERVFAIKLITQYIISDILTHCLDTDTGSVRYKEKENRDTGSVRCKGKQNTDTGSLRCKGKQNTDTGSVRCK